jgi:hypothetical protein
LQITELREKALRVAVRQYIRTLIVRFRSEGFERIECEYLDRSFVAGRYYGYRSFDAVVALCDDGPDNVNFLLAG